MFRLLHSCLQALKSGGNIDCVGAYFEGWILKLNGFLPQFSHCMACRKEVGGESWLSGHQDGVFCDLCTPAKNRNVPDTLRPFLSWIKQNPPSAAPACPLEPEDLPSIRRFLQKLLCFHLEREPRSLRYL